MEICGAAGPYAITLPGAPSSEPTHAPLCCLAACAAAVAGPPETAPGPRLALADVGTPALAVAQAPAPSARDAHRSRAPPLPA